MKRQKSPCPVVFLLVITLFMCAIGLRTFTRQVLVKRLGMSNAFTSAVLFDAGLLNQTSTEVSTVDVDWAQMYPFPGASITDTQPIKRYTSTVNAIEERIKAHTTDFLPFRQVMVELASKYESALGWDYVSYSGYNGIVTIADSYLATVSPRINVSKQADITTELSNFCEDTHIPFVYVCAPSKVCKYVDGNICGVTDYSDQNTDEFLSLIDAAGVSTLDLRKSLHQDGIRHHSLFFRTDHHWLPQAGLWAANKVAELLSERCCVRVDTTRLDPKQYREKVYSKWFLGSQGKKVTLQRAKPEDIALLYPNYDTSLRYEVMSLGIDTEGDFSVLYDMSQIEEKDYYRKNPYEAYIYADQPLEIIENNTEGLNGHILVIHDSFGNTVVPFLAMGVHRVDSIDPRHFSGSLRAYIQTERPDAVVMLYNPSVLGNESAFELM